LPENRWPVPYVYLYLDPSEDLKGQGYRMSAPTDGNGAFSFDGLRESSYFLAVRKRQDGQRVGPVRKAICRRLSGQSADRPCRETAG